MAHLHANCTDLNKAISLKVVSWLDMLDEECLNENSEKSPQYMLWPVQRYLGRHEVTCTWNETQGNNYRIKYLRSDEYESCWISRKFRRDNACTLRHRRHGAAPGLRYRWSDL